MTITPANAAMKTQRIGGAKKDSGGDRPLSPVKAIRNCVGLIPPLTTFLKGVQRANKRFGSWLRFARTIQPNSFARILTDHNTPDS